ncbi:hypothetical protein LCGC14_0505470 [marine sediment metagenome]|uniref:Uncharacterized protein n=1 Tax=marine sediment metagenome TaxID=412755 RepID=A0A0F9SL64_9ZZZZ|nr:MAG: hypothetical protein Lokiarch_19770 [Candidatus Lokiarchaeum sp. GC14_75]HEA70732.1 hypothetical protein [archaeon]
MQKTKKVKVLSTGLFFLVLMGLLISVRAENTMLLVEDSESNYYLHSTMSIWQREDADPNRDYYAVKLTVAEHYAQNNVWNEMLVMDAGFIVYTSGALINRAERQPGAGLHWGGSYTVRFGHLFLPGKLPGGVMQGIYISMPTDTDTEQQWHVYGSIPVTSNYLDFIIKVSVPEGAGLHIYGWSWAKWHIFWWVPPGWFIADKSGYGPTHDKYVSDYWSEGGGGGGGGGGCPILSVYDGAEYIDEGLLDIHNIDGIDVETNHTLITTPGPVENRYFLRLTEHPKTISHIDQVQLLGRLSNGNLIPLQLSSAVHSTFGQVRSELRFSDDKRVDVLGADHTDGDSEFIDLQFIADSNKDFTEFILAIEGNNIIIK